MPAWLTEDPSLAYLVLGLLALGSAAAFWVRQDRRFLVGLAAAAVLLLIVLLVSRFVVTDREQIALTVREMAAGVGRRDVNGIFSHISDKFRLGGRDKKAFRQLADAYVANVVSLLKEAGFQPSERLVKAEEALARAFSFELLAALGPTCWLAFVNMMAAGGAAV